MIALSSLSGAILEMYESATGNVKSSPEVRKIWLRTIQTTLTRAGDACESIGSAPNINTANEIESRPHPMAIFVI